MTTDNTQPSRKRVCAIRVAAARLAAERQAEGITNVLLQSETRNTCTHVGTVLAKMAREGSLIGVSVPGRPRHWFATEQSAQQWAATHPPQPKATPTPRQQMTLRSRPGLPAPVKLAAADRIGEPIITERTKITRDHRLWPTARWQMRQEAPDERWPSFAASRPGINPDTGKPWSAAA